MLRHLKMEYKKQQQQQLVNPSLVATQEQSDGNHGIPQPKPKRVRGRRSSKPQMEKRRRARINECLEILKTYVLTDSNNLSHLGINNTTDQKQSANNGTNTNEESIACQILKSSGLINRHKGRKNPNKLEKADILELTVDYVKRLHDQRNKLLQSNAQQQASPSLGPLSISLKPTGTAPPSPPPSSASNSPQPLLTIMTNNNNNNNHNAKQQHKPAKLAHMLTPPIQQQHHVVGRYNHLHHQQNENVDIDRFNVASDINNNNLVLDLTKGDREPTLQSIMPMATSIFDTAYHWRSWNVAAYQQQQQQQQQMFARNL